MFLRGGCQPSEHINSLSDGESIAVRGWCVKKKWAPDVVVRPPILEAFAPLPAARWTFREPICRGAQISSYRCSRFGLEYLIVMGFVAVPAVWFYRIAIQICTVSSKDFQLPLYEHNPPGFKLSLLSSKLQISTQGGSAMKTSIALRLFREYQKSNLKPTSV